jgi:hypothetical protein
MFAVLQKRFEPVLADFMASPAMIHLAGGRMTLAEYRSYLKQIYYCVRENPQLQALAAVYLRGEQRRAVKTFFQHAVSEIGHDQLALNDYITLGGEADEVPFKNPLPATTALTAFAFYQIYNLNPLGYLGYLYFLEFMPTQAGPVIAGQLAAIGAPEGATTFLRDHIEIDQAHNRLMERYADTLLRTDADVDSVAYAMKTTGYLYAQVVESAIRDAHANEDTGWNWEELRTDRKQAEASAQVA